MIEDVFVLVAITYAIALTLGFLMERHLKIPWMFSALFLGIAFSSLGYFTEAIGSESFQTLSTLGMLTLLFLIGFNLDMDKIRKLRNQIVLNSFIIIFFEAICVSLLLYLAFPSTVGYSFMVAFIVALSFATVGEAVLLPILREFNVIKTKFGQLTLGIGTFDDIIEVLTLVLAGVVLASHYSTVSQNLPSPALLIGSLGGLIAVSLILIWMKGTIRGMLKALFSSHHFGYLAILMIFFCFIAVSGSIYEGLAPIAAILSGIVSRELFPKKIVIGYERIIDFLGYMFLSPIFFLGIGAEVSISSILAFPILLLAIWITAKGAKLLISYITFRNTLGTKYSLLMGLGLSVRFSTSLIVQYILFQNGIITLGLYSALIGTAILMKPVIIILYSWGLSSEKPP